MTDYNPDQWVVLKIVAYNETHYRVFGTWRGGYLYGDSWRMNSGVTAVEELEDHYVFVGSSGSRYKCYKETYGAAMYSAGIIQSFIQDAEEENVEVEILDKDIDFAKDLIIT
jgi:hypothetical protein